MKDKSVFQDLLEKFITETKCIKSGYPYGPFLPVTYSNYKNAPIKIFYYGRDTYYWVSKDKLGDDYLEQNAKFVTPKDMLGWKNNAGSFWNFVIKLHVYIRTGRLVEDMNNLTQEDKLLLNEIGYGNLYSIEIKQTLEKEGVWEQINQAEYKKLRSKSRFLNKIKYVLDMYHPDVICICTWEDYIGFLDGLDYICHQELYEESRRSVFSIKGYNTKIVWTSHPRRFSYIRTNANDMIIYLGKTIHALFNDKII